jgi:hypothetical protein
MSEPISSNRLEDTTEGKFLIALGLLIQAYAQTEFILRYALEQRAGVRLDIARILIGPIPTKHVVDRLRLLLKVPDYVRISEQDRGDVVNAFDQFGLITLIRDRLVHAGGHTLDTGKILIRPKPPAKVDPDDYDEHLYETPIIYDMMSDVQLVATKVILHFGLFGETPDPEFLAGWRQGAAQPWRYKPRPPITPNRQPRTKPK